MPERAVVLLSGGLDSVTVLALAASKGLVCHTLAFDYGQRHRFELAAAARASEAFEAASHTVLPLDLTIFGGSALTDDRIGVPKAAPGATAEALGTDIPVTYVPARNLIFLSVASAYAEVLGARSIWLGVNAIDYSGYPDCRPEFIESFAATVGLATRVGTEGGGLRIETPLIELSKAGIIGLGHGLGVDYGQTHSCYDPSEDGLACGRCDSCVLRRDGFRQAGVADPTRYMPARG
ncbi:MAG: 7-cyano-7-deazaguanine synthase QueC [Planctomycetota bacterium]